MISVNQSRNTILFLLNKSNRGFISPEVGDSFMNLAQLDLFEQVFFDYTNWKNKQNRRLTNTEYSDISKNLQEIIDIFSEYTTPDNFTYNPTTNVWGYTGNDLYRTENLSLVDAADKKVDIELVNKSELNILNNSQNAHPTLLYPVYVKLGESYRIFPLVPTGYNAEMFYIRRPKTPKWTYNISQGNPIFNASSPDLQNIELPESMFAKFIVRVMLYCGVSLREQDVVAIANNEEVMEAQKQA